MPLKIFFDEGKGLEQSHFGATSLIRKSATHRGADAGHISLQAGSTYRPLRPSRRDGGCVRRWRGRLGSALVGRPPGDGKFWEALVGSLESAPESPWTGWWTSPPCEVVQSLLVGGGPGASRPASRVLGTRCCHRHRHGCRGGPCPEPGGRASCPDCSFCKAVLCFLAFSLCLVSTAPAAFGTTTCTEFQPCV